MSLNAVQGAQTTIFCAVDESVASESGKYYDNCKVKEPNKLAVDADLARRLWNVTLELVEDYTKLLLSKADFLISHLRSVRDRT